MPKRRRAALAALSLAVVAVAGCAGPASMPERSPDPAAKVLGESDVATVRASADRVAEADRGRYVLTQSVIAEGQSARPMLTRTGQYDAAALLHQVEVRSTASDTDIELTFLTTADDVLMRNRAFTAQHGKSWTRLPADALAAVGIDPTAAAPEPPALDVVRSAALPASSRPVEAGATEFEVLVSQYDAIELFANAGYVKMAELTGLSVEELPSAFDGTMPATVSIGEDGVLRSVELDLQPLLERAAEVSVKPDAGRFDGGSILVRLTFEPGAAVDIAVPAESDVGSVD